MLFFNRVNSRFYLDHGVEIRIWGRAVTGGGAGSPPLFGRTVNPISTRGADYAHHSTVVGASSPLAGFSDLANAAWFLNFGNKNSAGAKDLPKIKHFIPKKTIKIEGLNDKSVPKKKKKKKKI